MLKVQAVTGARVIVCANVAVPYIVETKSPISAINVLLLPELPVCNNKAT